MLGLFINVQLFVFDPEWVADEATAISCRSFEECDCRDRPLLEIPAHPTALELVETQIAMDAATHVLMKSETAQMIRDKIKRLEQRATDSRSLCQIF